MAATPGKPAPTTKQIKAKETTLPTDKTIHGWAFYKVE